MDVDYNTIPIENTYELARPDTEPIPDDHLSVSKTYHPPGKGMCGKITSKTVDSQLSSQTQSQTSLRDAGNSDVEEQVIYSIFSRLEDVESYIMEQEIAQTTKFILNRMCKGFGTADPDVASQKKQRVKWIASGVKFMGRPFLLIGDKRYDCRHGKDKNVAKKFRYNEKRKNLVNSGEQQRINNVRKNEQLKTNCPARIQIRDILVYKEFGVEGSNDGVHELPSLRDPTNNDSYNKDNAQRRLRDRTSARIRALLEQGKQLQTERQFHVSFPRLEAHRGHEVGQAAGTKQRLDRRVIQHIHKLVSEGVIHIDHMKPRMDEFVAELFAGKALPERDNRRYYPLAKDISNHIQKSMAAVMSCEQSTDNLQQLYENLRKENPSDFLHFQPSVEGQSHLIYLHQTCSQQVLVKRQCTCPCLLDVKYRDKKSSLPMFLVSVDTDTGCQTVATIILEHESDLGEAMTKLKSNNPSWSPVEWTVDNMDDRVSMLQPLFPGSVIKDSQNKTVRGNRRRGTRKPPPKPAGEALRDILSEIHQLTYHLPATSEALTLVSSLEAVRKQAAALVNNSSSSTVIVTSKGQPHLDTQVKSPTKSHKRTNSQEVVWDGHASKMSRDHQSASGAGLGNIIQAIDEISRSQHELLSEPHSNSLSSHAYMNSTPQLLPPSLVQPHHTQTGVISQHSSIAVSSHHIPATSVSTSHGILNMAPSNLSLQVAGMITDSYNVHSNNAIGSVYGQLPAQQQQQRHYLDFHQPDTQSFVQQMAKIGNE